MDTAYVYDPIYLEHDLPSHPENAQRLKQIMGTLEEAGMLAHLRPLEPRPATAEELERVHTPAHIERVQRVAQAGGGYLDPDTYVAPRSFDAALMAAGGLLRAVEAVLAGEVANGFALVRPPGHHATATRGMGFCLFNNVAVAARAALTKEDVARVFIVDFDVHHGNGTQDAFADDPAVFYVSTHQYPHYPGTGHWRETGSGAGAGTVLNVPLPAGVGDAGYAQIFVELVWPLAERFCPDLILVSAGYDAHWSDPLAQMTLSLTGYAWLGQELVRMAEQLCDGRIVFTLEGGYQLDVLACGVLNGFYAMRGEESIADPIGPSPYPERPVDALVARLKEVHSLD
jgi:acetoin utilization deacetylase AcuC-like enzyme